MTINVDFTGVEVNDGDFEPLPEGVYNCSVFDITVEENKKGDGNYLKWQLKVLDDKYNNRRLWYNTSLKPQSLWKLKQILNRIAPDIDWSKEYGVGEIIDIAEGLPCRAEVSYDEEYENNNVDDIIAPKDSAKTEAEDKDEDLPI